MKRAQRPRKPRRDLPGGDTPAAMADLVTELGRHHETSPRLTGGDLDADWRNAWDAGDEAVGGSTSTPDQDVVDELGEALGVAQAPDAELQSSAEILDDRRSSSLDARARGGARGASRGRR
jgi:Family of unknown function (DUF6335)